MKVILAIDSFKGCLSSIEANQIVANTIKSLDKTAEVLSFPVADGGEGTMDAIASCVPLKIVKKKCSNPLMEEIEGKYGIFEDGSCLIECAITSGITLIPYKDGNAKKTTSLGMGELINDAINNGATKIYVALGGSATNDGGIGLLSGLGIKFLDKDNNCLLPIGENLININSIDIDNLNPKAKQVKFIILSDVINPLIGENGATLVYGKQKGAVGECAKELENGMKNYARIINNYRGRDVAVEEGSGAAGGISAGLKAFFDTELKSGADFVLDKYDIKAKMQDADVVITGEGKVDCQSFFGKLVSKVLERAPQNAKKYIISGASDFSRSELVDKGIDNIATLMEYASDRTDSKQNAKKYLVKATIEVMQTKEIFFDNILNFRDSGGMVADNGKRLRYGLLYRGASQDNATESDIERLKTLGIVGVYDFRNPMERKGRLENAPKLFGAKRYCYDMLKKGQKLHTLSTKSIIQKALTKTTIEDLKETYRSLPFDNGGYKMMFDELKLRHAPILIHCAAGKDRTGVGVALILKCLGINYKQIEDDYMFSNKYARELQLEMQSLFPKFMHKWFDRKYGLLFSVFAELLEATFEEIQKRYPTFEEYMLKEYNYTQKDIEQLKEFMLR